MSNTRRKNIKKTRKRTDHPAGCRISTEERTKLYDELIELERKSGIKVSLGAYTKHALLEHGRLRRLEDAIKAHAGDGSDDPQLVAILRSNGSFK